MSTCEPDGGAVSEHREETSMKNFPPVGEVQTPDGVAQKGQHRKGGLGTGSHDRNVSVPRESGGEEDTKVAD